VKEKNNDKFLLAFLKTVTIPKILKAASVQALFSVIG
jgi:hypothetical protein